MARTTKADPPKARGRCRGYRCNCDTYRFARRSADGWDNCECGHVEGTHIVVNP